MKRYQILLLCLVGVSALFTSCTTTNTDEGAVQGISGEGIGQTRESVYQWQDRTFRQLAYR